MYRCDPKLPTEAALTVPPQQEQVDLDSYKSELVSNLADAWKMAQEHVKQAQRRQKTSYHRSAKPPSFRVGDRVFLYMPTAKSNKAYKFTKPFQGPSTLLFGCMRMMLNFNRWITPGLAPFMLP